MERGRPVQVGTPEEVYLNPASPFVARFLGHRNLVSCRAFQEDDGMRVDSVLGRWHLPGLRGSNEMIASQPTLLIPPEAVSLHPVGEGGLEATVEESVFRGGRHHIRLSVNGCSLQAEVSITSAGSGFTMGQRVAVAIDEKRIRLLPWGLEQG